MSARQEVVTDRDGNARVLDYDQRGNVIQETQPDGKVIRRTFDARNNRLSETEPHDPATTPSPATTSYTYDLSDNLLTTTDPLGNTTTYTYNVRQQVLTTKDARGKTTTNVYDAKGNLLSTTDALGGVTSHVFDTRGNLASQTVTVGGAPQTTTYTYDSVGNLTKEKDAEGHETSYAYDTNGNRTSQTTTRTTASGTETLVTAYTYNKLGLLTKTTDPDGSFTETVYDVLGRQAETHDKRGRATVYTYDDLGRLSQTTYPDLSTEESTYDGEGRRLTSKDRGGRTTTYAYDGLGRLKKATYADGTSTENTYDGAGRLVATKDARGKTTTYEYDPAGRRTKVKDPVGHETVFTYDQNGNQKTVKDARLNVVTHEYDDLNRRTKTIFPPAISGAPSTFTTTSYDELGRRTSETDQAGRTTSFTYDALGRLVRVTDALGQQTVYGYDELGNRTSQTDANGHETRFEYDKQGRQTARILPDGKREEMTYDTAGNLATRTNFMGRVTTYAYDDVNRLLSRTYPNPAENVSFTYTPTGRRATATDGRGTTTYGYDVRDRLTSLVQPAGSSGAGGGSGGGSGSGAELGSLAMAYDGNGNRTSLAVTVGPTGSPGSLSYATGYTYDDAGRLDVVTDPVGRAYDHGYDQNGNRSSLAHPNGVTTAYTYDNLNRLTNLAATRTLGVVHSQALTLGPAGNRTQIVENDGSVKTYRYDGLYRLTGETVSGLFNYSKTFVYDAVGNRQSQATALGPAGSPSPNLQPGTMSYGYDTRDRLQSERLDATPATAYGWDDNGNLTTKDAEATYFWDHENRLTGVQKVDGTVVEHLYDADGNRVQTKTTPAAVGGIPQPAATIEYLVDTSGSLSHVVAEINASTPTATLQAMYIRGDDLLAVMRPQVSAPAVAADWQSRFYHSDSIGSIRRLTDEAANITDGYTYSAFGELLGHSGTDPQPYAFTGEPLDPNSGFQYHRARWMDPRVGRFAGMDPFEGDSFDPVSLHRYLYAGGDPPNRIDPSGRWFATFSLSVSIQGILAATAVVSASAVFGAIDGGIRAQLQGQDWYVGALKGARVGIFLSLLGSLRAAQPFLVAAGTALAGTAAFTAYMDGNTGLALYNGILFVGGATAVLSSISQQGFTAESVLVYRSIDPSTGQVVYIGITESFATRAAAHLRTKGVEIEQIGSLSNLTRNDARAVEQALIAYYGLGKNGGSLLNKINSISPLDPEYAAFLARGQQLLKQGGYPGI